MLEHTQKASVMSAAGHASTLETKEGQARRTIQTGRKHWAQERKQIKHTKQKPKR